MEQVLLLILALAPGIALLLYILHMDRREREPLGYILKIMALGAASFIPAVIIELLLEKLPVFGAPGFTGALLVSFLQVAPAEELCKLGVVLLFVWNSPNFNEENDGIVYVGSSALGFAMLENVFYVMDQGFSTGIARALTALPLHSFTGVIMGYFTGVAKFTPSKVAARRHILRGFIYAYLFHGIYDSFALSGTAAALLIVPLVIALAVFGTAFLRRGRKLSLQRWGGAAESPAPALRAAADPQRNPAPVEKVPTASAGKRWKIFVSRTLLTVSALFWMLVMMAYLDKDNAGKFRLDELIIGSIFLTVIPVLGGIVLEISFHREKKPAPPAA